MLSRLWPKCGGTSSSEWSQAIFEGDSFCPASGNLEEFMDRRNQLILASATSALLISNSAPALTQSSTADCQKIFEQADVNKDASLRDDEALVYIKALIQAGVTLRDPLVVPYEEFIIECRKGTFANMEQANTDQLNVTTGAPAVSNDTAISQSADDSATEATDPDQSSARATTTDSGIINQQSGQSDLPAEHALAIPDAIMASNLIGASIYSANNESIAKIKDIILAEQGGKATHIIVGAGDNNAAVEFSQLKIVATDRALKLFMDATQADLAKLPALNY
jgi:sporulation protein YlmC with PRC-barrel domain